MPLSPEGLFPAVGMHSLGEEVRLHLHAELGTEEDDSAMMVDSYEEEWGRLHDVKVCGTVSAAPHPQVRGGVRGGGPLEELPPPPPPHPLCQAPASPCVIDGGPRGVRGHHRTSWVPQRRHEALFGGCRDLGGLRRGAFGVRA